MKITPAQLKRIIREEIKKSISEPSDSMGFYEIKSSKLRDVLDLIDSVDIVNIGNIDSALKILDEIQALEESQPTGEDVDIRSAMMDLQSVSEAMNGLKSVRDFIAGSLRSLSRRQ